MVSGYKKCETCNGTGQVLDDTKVGAEHRVLREYLGISLRALAREIGWSPAYLSDLERGKRRWTIEKERKVNAAGLKLKSIQ